jgi:hypothetical protein
MVLSLYMPAQDLFGVSRRLGRILSYSPPPNAPPHDTFSEDHGLLDLLYEYTMVQDLSDGTGGKGEISSSWTLSLLRAVRFEYLLLLRRAWRSPYFTPKPIFRRTYSSADEEIT